MYGSTGWLPFARPHPEDVPLGELQEKVGGMAADLVHVGHPLTSNGISNEVAYVYLATGVACPD